MSCELRGLSAIGNTRGRPKISNIHIRPAVDKDVTLLFKWRNLPEIIAKATIPKYISWEEHRLWFQNIVAGHRSLLRIVEVDGVPVGQVRVDHLERDHYSVSAYLLPSYTGRGIGPVAVRRVCWQAFAKFGVERIVALIRQDNSQSISAFRKAGFRMLDCPRDGCPANHVVAELGCSPDVPHNRLTYGRAECEAVLATVDSGHWAHGPRTEQLESALARVAGVDHAICVASGLASVRLILMGLGVKKGDLVLVPAYSCVALANAVLACGARPVPVDITTHDYTIDPVDARSLVNKLRPAAIVSVNTFGAPAVIEESLDAKIPIIEDCAHAFGISVGGKHLGGRSQAAVLSFSATKLIGAGKGGAVLTASSSLAGRVRNNREYTDRQPNGARLGDTMTDLAATLALCQLDRLQEFILAREKLAAKYGELLSAEKDNGTLFRLPETSKPRVWYRYPVEMRGIPAEKVVSWLSKRGIHAAQPVTDWRSRSMRPCPSADHAYRYVVSLPLYPTLQPEELEKTAYAFLECVYELSRHRHSVVHLDRGSA